MSPNNFLIYKETNNIILKHKDNQCEKAEKNRSKDKAIEKVKE